MRLKILFLLKSWYANQAGLVLGFTALILPIILIIGVLILQSGQLYLRQAQLQFLARQAANSSLLTMGEILQETAERNYEKSCSEVPLPSICASSDWQDFLSTQGAINLAHDLSSVEAVELEVKNFSQKTDPQKRLLSEDIKVVFPYGENLSDELVTQVIIDELQPEWFGNVLRLQDYSIRVEARSYLKL